MASKTFETTTLDVRLPENFALLEAKFTLYRYSIPQQLYEQYRNTKSKNKDLFWGNIHNLIREQLGQFVYKSYLHVLIKGVKTWVIYVLCPKDEKPIDLLLSRYPIKPQHINFGEIESFNLLKLLQAEYVHGLKHSHFVGRDDCYVYARQESQYRHTCLKIELSEAGDYLRFIGRAKTFYRVDSNHTADTYYMLQGKASEAYFVQLKPSEVDKQFKAQQTLYITKPLSGGRTKLPYLSANIKESRVHILRQFITEFAAHIKQYGFKVEPIKRQFHEFKPVKSGLNLPLSQLDTIYILDVRHNKQHSLQAYIDIFEKALKLVKKEAPVQVNFKPIAHLTADFGGVVLVLQDGGKKAYVEGGVLYGKHKDPHKELYEQYPHIPKQFFNVNRKNDAQKDNITKYLSYDLLKADKGLGQALLVSIYQLCLKNIVLKRLDITDFGSPFVPAYSVFVRKTRKEAPPVALYFDGNIVRFLTLQTEDDRKILYEKARICGFEWSDMETKLLEKYKPHRSPDEELTSYNVFFAPGLFVDIENMNERVLYNTPEMLKRLEERNKKRPIDEFKLSHRVTEAWCVDYDEILDETTIYRSQISAEEIATDLMERIAPLLGFKVDVNGEVDDNKAYKRAFYRPYQKKLKKFKSWKEKDLHLYTGIWFTDDLCYIVGSRDNIKQNQERAHLIRRFDVFFGKENFDIELLLETLGVQFVRFKQYTVLPYFYRLIDIYIENILNLPDSQLQS